MEERGGEKAEKSFDRTGTPALKPDPSKTKEGEENEVYEETETVAFPTD